MAKALRKNPRSLRLGEAEIEAAAMLGKPTEHLVARGETRARTKRSVPIDASEPEIDERLQKLFSGDTGDAEAELIELGGSPHVAGGDQDAADATAPGGLGLTDDQQEALCEAYWQTRYAEVEITAQVHAGAIDLLRTAPPGATVAQLLTFLEAMP